MKNLIIILAMGSFFCSGCITMPDPISNDYLSEMTEEDHTRLEKIKVDVISKNKDKEASQKDLGIAEQMITVCKAELSQIKATKALLQEEERLYTLARENKELTDVQDKLIKCEQKKKQANAHLVYNEVKRHEIKTLLKVKEAELAVKVAELDYEKAKIAKEYQTKRPEKFGKNIIDDTVYEKSLNEKIDNLEEKTKEYNEAIKMLNKAEEDLKKTGYEVKS